MDALDSPLEALAFGYLSFGLLTVVNNVWTWVAVITAAVSVWRLRALSPRGRCPASLITEPVSSSSAVAPAPTSTSTATLVGVAAGPSTTAPPSSPCVFNSEGRTSGKFTVYYDQEEEEEDVRNDDGNGEGDGDDGNVEGEKEWLKDGNWEVTMRMRMVDDMGFYRYQDLTVLDGSVVRLWESCRRRGGGNATPLIRWGAGEGW